VPESASGHRTAEQIAGIRTQIQRGLDERRDRLGFALKVADDFLEEGDWLYLVVFPDREGVRAHVYAEALTEVEDEMREAGMDRHVLLVPALPG